MSPMMITTIFLGVFGKKAKFIVTPKDTHHLTFKDVIMASWSSIVFGVLVGVATYFAYQNIIPTLFLVLACFLSPFAILLSNIPLNNVKNKDYIEEVDCNKSFV